MISVLIPVYNCETYLTGCLNSILNQSFSDFEVICINDGSTDSSAQILASFQMKDNRIKVFHIENHGQAYARNLGVSKASGEVVCFIDADDEVSEHYLSKMMEAYTEHDADLVVCGMNRVFKKKGNLLEIMFQYYPELNYADSVRPSECKDLLLKMINAPYCKLIRKSFLDEHKIAFLMGRIYEDFYFTQMLLMHNPKVVTVNEQMYNYHVYPGTTMTSKKSRVHDMYVVMDQLLHQYELHGLKETFHEELEYLCVHHICIGTVYRAFMNRPMSLFKELKQAGKYMKDQGFSIDNRYCREKQWFVRLYLNLFFHK